MKTLATVSLVLLFAHAEAQPVQPTQPVQPVRPVEPVQPVQPVRPVQPVQPIQPVRPVQPVLDATTNQFAAATNLPAGMAERPPWATNVRPFFFTNFPVGSVSFPTGAVPAFLTNITTETSPELWLSNWWRYSTNRSFFPQSVR
jgi:hypothetical protein